MSLIKSFTKDAVPSLVSGGTIFLGDVKNCSNMEVEGSIEGNVLADTLTIRETGSIKGDVKSKTFNIKGNFEGKAYSEKINISDTAVVNGALEYKFLVVDYGANINCDLKRTTDEKPSSKVVQQLEPKNKS
ncbi:MAG: polymer-forming cytoskeletal protein [Rickettsiales bacterium]|jgi:cytoskeletal protein CcmA (bactofilin family)|nr:polymer-forming cytoskeletal protein [Rickettsiales bacterium]